MYRFLPPHFCRVIASALVVSLIAIATCIGISPRASAAGASNKSTCAQPPANINLLKLSDAQLVSLGLPQHAQIEANLKAWQKALGRAKHRGCGSAPQNPGGGNSEGNAIEGYNGCNTTSLSCVWGGPLDHGLGRTHYFYSSMEFYVPSIAASRTNNAKVSLWAGVGGDSTLPEQQGHSTVLVQAGIELSQDSNNNQITTPWWEIVRLNTNGTWDTPGGLGQMTFRNLTVYNGADVYVYADSNVNQDGYDYFYVSNLSNGQYNGCYYPTSSTAGVPNTCYGSGYDSNYNSDSASGECISERVSADLGGNTQYPLAQFQSTGQPANTAAFQNCDPQGVDAESQPYTFFKLVNRQGATLADGGFATSSNFTMTFHNDS